MNMKKQCAYECRSRGKTAFWFLILLGFIGGYNEYKHYAHPLGAANIALVYMANEDSSLKNESSVTVVEPSNQDNQIDNAEYQVLASEISGKQELSYSDNIGLEVFLRYMQETDDLLQKVKREEPVLEKIVQEVPIIVEQEVVPMFDEGKIEVFDSEKGVIKVIEEVKNTENNDKAISNSQDESGQRVLAPQEMQENGSVLNEEDAGIDNENNVEIDAIVMIDDENEDEALDMMKNIINKQ